MDFKKYKYFYLNGYSFTEGGGLEEPKLRDDSRLPLYEEKYGVTWKNRSEINFGKRLSDIIGVPCKNDSKSGTGVDRLVRTTYEFLYENWSDRDKIFLILEKIDASRSEIYFNHMKEYYIVNSHYDDTLGKDVFDSAVREHFNDKLMKEDKEYEDVFRTWFDNHYNYEQKSLQNEKAFLGLYSFCKVNNIKVFLIGEYDYYMDVYDKNDIITFGDKKIQNIYDWFKSEKMEISDELDGKVIDNHPGYYGHIECAKEIAKFIGWSGEINIKERKK